MRYAVTVISVAYDLSWVSRSASHGKVSTVTAAQPSTFRACKRRYWAGIRSKQGLDRHPRSPAPEHIRLRFSRRRDSFGRALLRREIDRPSRW